MSVGIKVKTPIPVFIHASESVTQFGITAQLSRSSALALVQATHVGPETITILAVDSIGLEDLQYARELTLSGCRRFILVTSAKVDDHALRAALELGLIAIIDRRAATPEKLESLIEKASCGESALPSDLLASLFRSEPRPGVAPTSSRRGPRVSGLTPRETQVLCLVAEGLDTDEIATELSYSSRTVKNIVHAVTTRYCLRNRSHAVAYALREGLI